MLLKNNKNKLIKFIREQVEKANVESDLEKEINKITIKNPKTGKKNKLRTALVDKDNPNHSKAIQMLRDLKKKTMKAGAKSDNPNIIFMDKTENALKKLEHPEEIRKKLKNTKTKTQFKKTFRDEVDPDGVIVDNDTLDFIYKAWNKIETGDKKQIDKSKRKSKKLDYLDDKDEFDLSDDNDLDFLDDSSYDNNDNGFESPEEEKDEIKKLNVRQTIGLLTVAGMFGGIDKTFNFTSSFVTKYLERFREEFSNKSDQLKDLFNFNKDH